MQSRADNETYPRSSGRFEEHVLPQGAKQRAELERAGKAPTPAATIASVRAVARILAEVRADAGLALVLDSSRYDDALVAKLRARRRRH